MKIRFAPLAAGLSVFAFLGGIAFFGPGELEIESLPPDDAQSQVSEPEPFGEAAALRDRTAGSLVPCDVPLTWRVARVDEPFDLRLADARIAFERAARVWEDAVGSGLFTNDPDGTLPVRFIYDDRQRHDEERLGLEAQEDSLDERRQQYNGIQAQIQDSLMDLQRRVASLNDSIRYWNGRADAPEAVLSELGATGRELDVERARLTTRMSEIEDVGTRLVSDAEQLRQAMETSGRDAEALEETFPGTRLQSGTYGEAVHTQNGRVASVTREIRIYRFDGLDELVHVAAHELGHALGLGHNTVPGGLMREEFARGALSEGLPRVHPDEVEALRSLCPAL